MWHWQLLPRDVNLLTVGRGFHRAGLLPSLRELVLHTVPTRAGPLGQGERVAQAVEALAQRERICGVSTDAPAPLWSGYAGGVGILWLGQEAFLFVDDAPDGLTGARVPRGQHELAPWILPAIADTCTTDLFTVQRQADRFLEDFGSRKGTPGQQILRGINWANIPLVWHPLFLTEARPTHTLADCEEAQVPPGVSPSDAPAAGCCTRWPKPGRIPRR